MAHRTLTETEKLNRAKQRAERKWLAHLESVREAVKRVYKVFTRSGEKVNARGSTISRVKWHYWIEEGDFLLCTAEMDEPSVGFGSDVIRTHYFEETIPLDMVDRGNATEIARFLRKRAKQSSKNKDS